MQETGQFLCGAECAHFCVQRNKARCRKCEQADNGGMLSRQLPANARLRQNGTHLAPHLTQPDTARRTSDDRSDGQRRRSGEDRDLEGG